MHLVKNSNISSIFPKHLFWDVDMDNVFLDEDADFIIGRVLSKSSKSEDLSLLESIYEKGEIKFYAIQHDIFGNERIEFLCKRYDLKPSSLRHYIQKQLINA
jgi:hypothetical protein